MGEGESISEGGRRQALREHHPFCSHFANIPPNFDNTPCYHSPKLRSRSLASDHPRRAPPQSLWRWRVWPVRFTRSHSAPSSPTTPTPSTLPASFTLDTSPG